MQQQEVKRQTQDPQSVEQTSCCIVGGGPAGVVLALLLARKGVPVILLETHMDFDREFRGDTIHPAVMEVHSPGSLALFGVHVALHPHTSTLAWLAPGLAGYLRNDCAHITRNATTGLFYFLFAAGTALAATFPYLLQLVSVTGIWEITFLITWLAPVVNWAWEHGFAWSQVRGGTLLYTGILTVILLGGGARLALFPSEASTVRVVGVSPSRTVEARYDQQRRSGTFDALFTGKASEAQRAAARTAYAKLTDDLFVRTVQEAKAGAKIVLWPEGGTSVLQEDETSSPGCAPQGWSS